MPKSFISASLESLRQAQKEFSHALRPGSILLVDSTFQGVVKQVQEGVMQLSTGEILPEVRAYLDDLRNLSLPQTSQDIYKQFFGPELPMQTHLIQSTNPPDLSSVSLVILSGSPANVTYATQEPNPELIPGLTHGEILRRESSIINSAFQQRIPLVGLCYGHQSVSHVLGGKVARLPNPIFGTWKTTCSIHDSAKLTQFGVNEVSFQHPVPAYHQDYVETAPVNSIPLFQAESAAGPINYGSYHPHHNALTVQYHPEYLFIEPLLTAIRTQQALKQPTSVASSIETLRLFAKLLESLN